MYLLVSPIFSNAINTLKQRHNSTHEWSLTLTNTSLEKLESNTLEYYGEFEDLNSKQISHLLINVEITRRPSIFSGYLYLCMKTHTSRFALLKIKKIKIKYKVAFTILKWI